MTQRTLFDKPLPHNGCETSKAAAESKRLRAGAQQQRVLECLQQAGDTGMTDEQIQVALGLSGDSERPRRRKLVELGLVADSGEVRETTSGHAAVIWVAVRSNKRLPLAV